MIYPLVKNFWADFKPDSLTMSLSVVKPDIPNHISKIAEENNLLLKEDDTFHISIVVSVNAKKLHEAVFRQENPEKVIDKIKELFEKLSWAYTPVSEYYLHENTYTKQNLIDTAEEDLTPHTRRTIVQRVDISDLEVFYTKLNEMLGISLPLPIPHITLFSWSDYDAKMLYGIGICSEEEFKAYTKKVLLA